MQACMHTCTCWQVREGIRVDTATPLVINYLVLQQSEEVKNILLLPKTTETQSGHIFSSGFRGKKNVAAIDIRVKGDECMEECASWI